VACVGFTYTPAKAKFASTLNGLGPPGLYGEHRCYRKRVDDLDSARLVDRSHAWQRPAAAAPTAVKGPHNAHCVTVELRPGYNMSHRMGRRELWHGHCNYIWQRGPKTNRSRKVKSDR